MFLLKYKVQALEDELVAKQAQVVRDRAAIRVLEAEWTYLNDPERLRELSAQYLGFGPPAITNIADIGMLPMKGVSDAASESTPAKHNPLDDIKPQFQTELRTPPAAPPARSPSVVSVTVARLQRLLFPTAAGATSSSAERP
ncbi:MAG: hypothetical protein LCH56_12050 [Proteobacteria bacterium]|nr:hypothetical protein [Pseudomonadota bacterium]